MTVTPILSFETLRKRAQFLFVRDGARASRGCLAVEARRRAPSGPVGVGITASRKVGNAVARNRAKRRLREAARKLLPELGLAGVDYVLVARQAVLDAPWAGLLDDLGNALIRLRADLERDRGAARAHRKPGAGKRKSQSKPDQPSSRAASKTPTESD